MSRALNRYRSVVLIGTLALAGCAASRVTPQTGTPVADPQAFVQRLRDATVPPAPRQVTFEWTLEERGSRVNGRGVVRVEAPERIRLDLFGARGDTYLVAALVGDEYRFPTSAAPPVDLPSPSLLWGALGVFEPPATTTLLAATSDSTSADVRFQGPDGQLFVYSFMLRAGGMPVLRRVERATARGVLETVTLETDTEGAIATTRYRDWTAFRDLVLTVQSVRDESAFPPEIWRPGA